MQTPPPDDGTDEKMIRLFVRIDFEDGDSIGPGKIRLLELVDELGSIRSAAAAMDMSYAHAWNLLHAVRETFHAPVISATKGGRLGGRTKLTELGRIVVKTYRDIERKAENVAGLSLETGESRPDGKHPLEAFRSL